MNMRMLGSVRECAQWIMDTELEQQSFFDVVVRSTGVFSSPNKCYGSYLQVTR